MLRVPPCRNRGGTDSRAGGTGAFSVPAWAGFSPVRCSRLAVVAIRRGPERPFLMLSARLRPSGKRKKQKRPGNRPRGGFLQDKVVHGLHHGGGVRAKINAFYFFGIMPYNKPAQIRRNPGKPESGYSRSTQTVKA